MSVPSTLAGGSFGVFWRRWASEMLAWKLISLSGAELGAWTSEPRL